MSDSDDFFSKVGSLAIQTDVNHTEKCDEQPKTKKINVSNVTQEIQADIFLRDRRWSCRDDIFWAASDTVETLAAGFYKCAEIFNIGQVLAKLEIPVDDLIKFPDSAMDEMLAEFATFLTLKSRFVQRGFLFKRGLLFWGPPGSGKTALIMLIAQELIRHNGVVIQIENPSSAATCLSMLRKIEPNRPIVAFMEDLDSLIEKYGESSFLSLLDGETQVDNIIYVATTNYPEKLDKRLVDRPSRFDTVKYIGMPNAASRRVYLKAKEPSMLDSELDDWTYETEGFSVAHLRELIILVKCYGHTLSAAVTRLRAMSVKPNSEYAPNRVKIGIIG
jgi:ATP-dependent Zn protease